MASVLDVGFLQDFGFIFSFLLVFAITYSLLQYTKALGEHKSFHAIIALSLSLLVILIPKAVEVIELLAPPFVILMIIILLFILMYKMFGATDENIAEVVRKYAALQWGILIIGIVVVAGVLGKVFFTGDEDSPTNYQNVYEGDVGGTGEEAALATLVHPKMLGTVMVLLIAVFTIATLSRDMQPSWPRPP